MRRRRVLYVTGTRAEFGLMRSTLKAIQAHKHLDLQLVVTGMHLSRAHGRTVNAMRADGWNIKATVPWQGSADRATGRAIEQLSVVYDRLKPDIVLVTGDRVEPFAAAAAARIGNRCVAHIHGGDRALGQLDDSLRHAITKLANIHFPATRVSGERIFQLGEDRFRIHVVGTPGLDGIEAIADEGESVTTPSKPFVLVALHPDTPTASRQAERAMMLVQAIERSNIADVMAIFPNNDPGWKGIAKVWESSYCKSWMCHRDLPRPQFLASLRTAAVLIGNSSSGIIEAASLGTPVINIGDRQRGRERSRNVIDVDWKSAALANAIRKLWNKGKPRRYRGTNVYGGGHAGERIASVLSEVALDDRLMNKLIRY